MAFSIQTLSAAAFVVAALNVAPTPFFADAEARPSTRSFTCHGVQDYVQRRGAVVMNTKNSRVYKRFVANRSYCSHSEIAETRTVPTKTGGCYLRICWEPLDRGKRFRIGN